MTCVGSQAKISKSVHNVKSNVNFSMLALLKPILFTFLKSKAIRQLALDLVRACVEKTDNDVDDKLCDMLEQALFPGK